MKEIIQKNENISEAGSVLMQTILNKGRVCIFPFPKNFDDSLRKNILA